MKKLSSSLLLILSFVFVLFSSSDVRANRAAGGDIAYKWISDSTYLLTYTFYKDCTGATEPSTVNLCYYNTCNTDKGNVTLSKKAPLAGNGQLVQYGCPGMPASMCISPATTLLGFRKWTYEGTVILPSKCASWHFIVSIAARNAAPTNYSIPAVSNNLFSETTLNNIDAPTSSSPAFGLDLIQYMCSGVKQNLVFTGTDADGDALTYTLIDPATAADNQTTCIIPPTPTSYVFGGVAGKAGTSLATSPFGISPGLFNLGGASGVMTFTPTALLNQQPILTMLVTKRRGTKVVGTMTRDIQFIISNTCTPTALNFVVDKATSSNVFWPVGPADTAVVCPNVTFQFAFNIISPDPTVTISNVTDNHTTFSATASTSTMAAYSGVGTNNVSSTFTWKPVELDEGTQYVEIRSEICKPGAPKTYRLDSLKIEIIRTAKIIAKDTMICFGQNTLLCALPFGAFLWSTTTSGMGIPGPGVGIATPVDSCTVVTPASTTTYLLETTGIRAFCKRIEPGLTSLNTNQAERKIVVVKPVIDAGPDTVMCSYSVHQLNANMPAKDVQPELTYKFEWTPGKWLDDSTSATPKLSFPPGTSVLDIPDSIVFYLKVITFPQLVPACDKIDTVTVQILKGFYILTGDTLAGNTGLGHMFRQKGVSDTAICNGKTIALLGWGDQRYNYIWNPAAGVSTPTGFMSGMTITPPDTGFYVYSLTAARAGCRDSTKQVRIVVEPNPIVDIGPDQTICFGDTINMYATITPSHDIFTKYTYNWSPGGALSRADTVYTYFTGYRSEIITLTVKTPAGCIGTDVAEYTVLPRYFMTASPVDTAICPGDTIQISAAGDALLKSVTWKPTTNIDSLHALTVKVNPVFTTDYVVVGLDSNQCIDSASVKVRVYPRATIYLEDTVTIYPGEVYQLKPEGNCLYHTWFPPIGLDNPNIARPKASPLLNTVYTLTGRSEKGCVAVDSIQIFVAPDSYIDIPNAFVPGRGENNVFKPVHLGDATLKSFSIFNRWGTKIFESSDINVGWDGTFGGQPQPLGVYVYVLEAITANKKLITKQGNVTLVR